jgi:hypothetical protein
MSVIQVRPESNPDERLNRLDVVRREVGSLRYGVVQIVVHDSWVTQIEKTGCWRLEKTHAQII